MYSLTFARKHSMRLIKNTTTFAKEQIRLENICVLFQLNSVYSLIFPNHVYIWYVQEWFIAVNHYNVYIYTCRWMNMYTYLQAHECVCI